MELMQIPNTNDPQNIFDRHFSLNCPHCSAYSNITAISIPRYEYLTRFKSKVIGIAYRCDSCNIPIFLRFRVYNFVPNMVNINPNYDEVERPSETFEFDYLDGDVKEDFREALNCYSNVCLNAFAAMCRRTVQSVCKDLGAKGKNKVLNQLNDLKDMAEIDQETFDSLKQIILDGHDGAHPHLPKLNEGRAAILLELMKDVLYQLYVRKGKLQKAMELRKEAVEDSKEGSKEDSVK